MGSMLVCSKLTLPEQCRVEALDGPILVRLAQAGAVARLCQAGVTAAGERVLEFWTAAGVVARAPVAAFLAARTDEEAVGLITPVPAPGSRPGV